MDQFSWVGETGTGGGRCGERAEAHAFGSWRLGVATAAFALAASVLGATIASAEPVRYRAVDGGPDYYARFSHPLPSGPNFFPIGVWFCDVLSQNEINSDKDVGLNLYVNLTGNSKLALI